MEESKVINNDNNTYIDTSLSTLLETNVSNNELNNDNNLLKSTDNEELVTLSSDNYTPILLIFGEGTGEPTDEEEPVLLEEDDEIQYEAVINNDYESDNALPTITFSSDMSTLCDLNYVIAVTESDNKYTPIDYESYNLSLSASFTNNGNSWCTVVFKSPLDAPFSPKLDVNNFPDYSNIIVPVVTCLKNTGDERNTVITFNIKNFNNLNHSIKLNVNQSGRLPEGPCVLKYISGYDNNDRTNMKYKILTLKIYYYSYSINTTLTHLTYIYENENDMKAENKSYNFLCFGIVDSNGNIYNNLPSGADGLENFSKNLKTTSETSYKLKLTYNTQIYRECTAAVMYINIPVNGNNKDDITVSYNNKPFITIKYIKIPEYTIIARAKWEYNNIYSTTYLYFLTNNNPKNEISYKHYDISNQRLNNIIFLLESKYQIDTEEKTLLEVLTTYNMKHDSGYSFSSYMNYNVIDISDCICDVDGNAVYLKDIESGDPFINFKIYIYTKNSLNEYILLGYISTTEVYEDYSLFIGLFEKKS